MSRPPRPSRTVNGVLEYRCTRCGVWKSVGGFYPLPWQLMAASRCKIRPACRACDNAARRRLRARRAGHERRTTSMTTTYFGADGRRFRMTSGPKTLGGWLRRQLGLRHRQVIKFEVIYGPPMGQDEYERLSAKLVAEVIAQGGDVYFWEGRESTN